MPTNRKVVLAAIPQGTPKPSDFRVETEDVAGPADGQVLIKTRYASVDPYMRGRMSGKKTYIDPIPVGSVVEGGSVGEVVESLHPDFHEGEIVVGMWGWQEYALSDGGGLQRFDPDLGPISTALGVLGMPGMTSYFGLLDVGRPQEGDEVFISGAAGAVGSLVGQIAKIQGCRVAGSAGSPAKIEYVTQELGFDEAFNYNEVDDYPGKLAELYPKGIDVYFDNVGGPITDAVFMNLALGARMVICGQIHQYNATRPPQGPRLLFNLIMKRARAEGFLVFDYQDRFPQAQKQIAQWLNEGRVSYRETVTEGIENAPEAFIGLFRGDNIGKQLVHAGD